MLVKADKVARDFLRSGHYRISPTCRVYGLKCLLASYNESFWSLIFPVSLGKVFHIFAL
jgi:hypothetical protein